MSGAREQEGTGTASNITPKARPQEQRVALWKLCPSGDHQQAKLRQGQAYVAHEMASLAVEE